MQLPAKPDLLAPDSSAVRLLLSRPEGSMAHFELEAGHTSRAVVHSSAEEIRYIVSSCGPM